MLQEAFPHHIFLDLELQQCQDAEASKLLILTINWMPITMIAFFGSESYWLKKGCHNSLKLTIQLLFPVLT